LRLDEKKIGKSSTIFQLLGFLLILTGLIFIVKWKKNKRVLNGTVTKGRSVGRQIGFPTLNLKVSNMPNFTGVFAGNIKINKITHKAAIFIGSPKTFNIQKKSVEAHILNFNKNIKQGTCVTLFIKSKIRDNKKFKTIEQLKRAIKKDLESVNYL